MQCYQVEEALLPREDALLPSGPLASDAHELHWRGHTSEEAQACVGPVTLSALLHYTERLQRVRCLGSCISCNERETVSSQATCMMQPGCTWK
jgi:hypothetical protein